MLEHLRKWMYRHARPLELALWRYHFEDGPAEDVWTVLAAYQNEDGGFGHGIEADNWNPASSPAVTAHAVKTLREAGLLDLQHPVCQGILRYLASGDGRMAGGWAFTIPSNDAYPRAPWWTHSAETNAKEHIGVTAELAAFVLRCETCPDALRQEAEDMARALLALAERSDRSYGDMGLQGLVTLAEAAEMMGLPGVDFHRLHTLLARQVHDAIVRDSSRWSGYCVRPSYFITNPESPYYPDNADIVHAELDYLAATLPQDDVWGIPWRWYGMEQYQKEFCISENWWKGVRVVEFGRMLRSFGRL